MPPAQNSRSFSNILRIALLLSVYSCVFGADEVISGNLEVVGNGTDPTVLSVHSNVEGGPYLFISKVDSGVPNQHGGALVFENDHLHDTSRNAGVISGSIDFNFSQPSSGASELAAQIKAISDYPQSGVEISTALTFSTFNSPYYSGVGSFGVAERMRISGNGNVGIGTSSPSAKLEVMGDGRFLSRLVVASGSADAPAAVYQGAELSSVQIPIPVSGDGSIILAHTAARLNGVFHLYWEGPNRVHDVIFAVNAYHFTGGEIKILSQSTYAGAIVFSNLRVLMSNPAYEMQLVVDISNRNGGMEKVRLSMLSGRANHITLAASGALFPDLAIVVPDVTAPANIIRQGPGGPSILFKNSYVGQPRIQLYDLEADPLAWMGSGVNMSGTSYEHSIFFPATPANSGRLSFGSYNGTTFNSRLLLTQDGKLGVGTTTPTDRLHVQDGSIMVKKVRAGASSVHPLLLGTQHVDGVAGVSGVAIREEGSDGNGQASGLILMTSGEGQSPAGRVYISSTGNVGIGNGAPTVPLEVQGAIKANGPITSAGTVTAARVRVPQSGDLSMGQFHEGVSP